LMSIDDLRQGAELAARLLEYPVEVALANCREIPEVNAFFYWQPVRGGSRIFVARDGTVMWAISSLSMEEMTALFASGRRTDYSRFHH